MFAFFLLLLGQVAALVDESVETCNFVNAWRQSNNLPAVQISTVMTLVADAHVKNLDEYYTFDRNCNTHSWLEDTRNIEPGLSWTSCCYTSDQSQAFCMHVKGQELSTDLIPYTGRSFENSAAGSFLTPQSVVELWKSSPGHNALLLSNNMQICGAAQKGIYFTLWMGDSSDTNPFPGNLAARESDLTTSRPPTRVPTNVPTPLPTRFPTPFPTPFPTRFPTPVPTRVPTSRPSPLPTRSPTTLPTPVPTVLPTVQPTNFPSLAPTQEPTPFPSKGPTPSPTNAFTTPSPTSSANESNVPVQIIYRTPDTLLVVLVVLLSIVVLWILAVCIVNILKCCSYMYRSRASSTDVEMNAVDSVGPSHHRRHRSVKVESDKSEGDPVIRRCDSILRHLE